MGETIRLEQDGDVVAAWKSGLALGRRLGFGVFKQACLSGAILELSRQVVENGRRGVCTIVDESDPRHLRARVTVDGCPLELLDQARARLNADVNIGPSLPAVKLRQVVESCDVAANGDGARISLTIHQQRGGTAKPGARPQPQAARKA